jgi:pSer/pThr/pTyr-binding forkhead associated (FHA) protein
MTNSPSASTSSSGYPSLKILSPDLEESTFCLKSWIRQGDNRQRITVGRNEDNDIVLADRHKMVSRWQFTLEYSNGRWWIADEDSANGTFVRKYNSNSDIDVRMEEAVPLRNGDEILVVGKWTESDIPVYWHLCFSDLDETIPVKKMQLPADLEYNFDRQQLFQVTRQERDEVKLRNQERSLIHYMALKNLENNNQPILCTYDELIEAIWGKSVGDEPKHTNDEVNHIGWSIRQKIQPNSSDPKFFETVKSKGCLFHVNIFRSKP